MGNVQKRNSYHFVIQNITKNLNTFTLRIQILRFALNDTTF